MLTKIFTINVVSALGNRGLQEIRVPLCGDVMLPKEVYELIDTPEVQRLRGLKQLGLSHLAYPGAVHTRFEHSLGTVWALKNILSMSNLHEQIDPEDTKILTKAALLHDVGHPAFSHIIDRLPNYPYSSHKSIAEDILTGKLKSEYEKYFHGNVEIDFLCDKLSNTECKAILNIFSGQSDPPFLSQLICGFIDADLLDYLRRDSYYCGVNYGNYDDRIFRVYEIHEGQLMLNGTRDAVSAAESVLVGRKDMWEAVYRHHTTKCAESMLIAALEESLGGAILPREIFVLTDEQVLDRIIQYSESSYARELAQRLKLRKLFKRAYVVTNQSRTRDLEAKLSKLLASKVERHNTILQIADRSNSCLADAQGNIQKKMSFEDILFDFVTDSPYRELRDIYLNFPDGSKIKLDWISTRIRNLALEYDNLWRFNVLVSDAGLRECAQIACEEVFGIESSLDFRMLAEKARRDYRLLDQLRDQSEKELRLKIGVLLKEIRETPRLSLEPIKVLATTADKSLTRTQLSILTSLKPQTVSHYLNKILEKEDEIGVRILESSTVKRRKYWRIFPESKQHVANILKTMASVV